MTFYYDMLVNQGETMSFQFPVLDELGQPVNTTGWTAEAMVRESDIAPVFYTWSSTNSNILVGTNPGYVTLKIPAADSLLWQWTLGLYDVLLTDTGGNEWRIAEGKVRVSSAITR